MGVFFPPFLFWIQVTETVLSGLSKKEFIVYQMTPMESKTELSNNNSGTIGSWEALRTAAGIGGTSPVISSPNHSVLSVTMLGILNSWERILID